MRATVKMPRVADTTDTVYVEEWLVQIGQRIAEGDDLLAVETDKAVVLVPAPVSGIVVELLVMEKQEIATGEPLAVIDVSPVIRDTNRLDSSAVTDERAER